MEKYSLKFLDLKTEEEYQKERNYHFRMPIFKNSHYGMMIISIIKLIIDIYHQDYSGLFAIIATQAYIAFSLFIVKLRAKYIQIALILFTYILMVYEWTLQPTMSIQALPLFINSFTTCNILFFMVLDVFESYFLIVTTWTFKLVYIIVIDTEQSINVYVATCVLMGFLCFSSRRLNYQSRSNYLLSQKEDLWNKILPQIVDQPFLLFTFNNEKIEFQYQYSKQINFVCQNTIDLKNFLRNSYHQNKTIEDHFFSICKNPLHKEKVYESLEFMYLKTQYRITYSIFYYQQPLILIKFQNIQPLVEKQQLQITQKTFSKQQYLLLKFFSKNLQLSLLNSDQTKIVFLRNLCYKHMLNYRIQMINPKIASEKLETLLKPLIQLFEYKNVDLQYQKEEIQSINTVRIYFRRLFYGILNNCKKNSRISIISQKNNLTIYFTGKPLNCKSNDIFNLVINSLVKSQLKNSSTQIKLQLYTDPLMAFK